MVGVSVEICRWARCHVGHAVLGACDCIGKAPCMMCPQCMSLDGPFRSCIITRGVYPSVTALCLCSLRLQVHACSVVRSGCLLSFAKRLRLMCPRHCGSCTSNLLLGVLSFVTSPSVRIDPRDPHQFRPRRTCYYRWSSWLQHCGMCEIVVITVVTVVLSSHQFLVAHS